MSCMNLFVLCFECHMRPFEALILLVMNHVKREKCRANSVNICSNCTAGECQLIDLF